MYYYIVLVLPAILFSLFASFRVKSTFNQYSKIASRSGLTGAQAARRVLDSNGLYNIKIERVSGDLTDHYDPKARVIRLSDSVYSSSSCAAIGVASHEAGHAIQHAEDYTPMKLRSAIIPATNLGARLSIPLILAGILFTRFGEDYIVIAYIGVLCFGLSLIFQLLTLPTEFNASNRAMAVLSSSGILTADELHGAKKVLSAAAMTYVAALAVTAMQFLRLFLMVAGNDRRR